MASSSNSSLSPPPSSATSSTKDFSSGGGSQIGYCIRTVNYIISTLNLHMAPIKTLKELTVEILLKIHCALLGIDLAQDFIPAANPTEDVQRMIFSLKDRFGADKFGALEPTKIAARNPTQLRFLLEHFHLILNHKMSKASMSHQASEVAASVSRSVNHLSNSSKSVVEQPTGTTVNESDIGDSFETVENVVVNIIEESTSSDEPTSDPLFKNGVKPSSSRKPQPARLTSSPIVVPDGKVSKPKSSHYSPNVSSIKQSQSALAPMQRTVNSSNRKINSTPTTPRIHQGFPSKSKPLQVKNVKTIPSLSKSASKSRSVSRKMPPLLLAASTSIQQQQPGPSPAISRNETQFMSESEPQDDDDDDKVVQKVRKMHSNIRSQITESLQSMDMDISQLKRKSTTSSKQISSKQSTTARARKPIPNLRWLMPVDLRFPNYTGGVIIPKCTTWRSNRKSVLASARPCSSAKQSGAVVACESEDRLLEELSLLAQMGSGIESDDLLEYDNE